MTNRASGELYLEATVGESDETELLVSVETYITLFALVNCDNYDVGLCFVDVGDRPTIRLSRGLCARFAYRFVSDFDSHQANCKLPLVKLAPEEENLIVGGLCAVLRWTLKDLVSRTPSHPAGSLLGFRGGCLTSCSEVSVWTKFCEVDFPRGVEELLQSVGKRDSVDGIPECVVRLEAHLQMPTRTHNIWKKVRDLKLQTPLSPQGHATNAAGIPLPDFSKKEPNTQIPNANGGVHLERYVAGFDVTLSDIVVFPCVQLLFKHLPCIELIGELSNVVRWYCNISNLPSVRRALDSFELRCFEFSSSPSFAEDRPISALASSYNSQFKDLIFSKVKCKNFDPSEIFAKLKASGIAPNCKENKLPSLNWEDLPAMLHPSSGELPPKRIERKCQQLNNIVSAVCQLALPDQTIVDFCSGGGHVGLILAHVFPKCKIILVENKEESLKRARKRATLLNLANIHFLQCNLDYFNGNFDIGVSLHACGSSTDLVIAKCTSQKASFVCCPCCYGAIRQTDSLTYPRSKVFGNALVTYKEYSMLAHCADRTHPNTLKYEDGDYCMNLIDSDRILHVQQLGYAAELTKLRPTTCSPKHNLLIGVKPS